MSDTPNDRAVMGGNFPPVKPPAETEVRGDLETRYPEVKAEVEAMTKALESFPEKIETEEDAKALTDNLGKIGKLRKSWKSWRADEKKPWNTIIGIVQNFFVTGEEKLEAMDELWRPRLEVYQAKKEAEATKAREAELERQRQEAARLAREAEERRLDAEYAEALVELAQHDERVAREATERANEERREAERRAEELAAEQRRIDKERRERDTAERAANASAFRDIRREMKAAEKLHALAEAEEASDDEAKELDDMVKAGGVIGNLASPVANSMLLDDEQKEEIATIRTRLGELRVASNERFNKRERTRRAKIEEANRKAEEAAAAERKEDAMWRDAYAMLAAFDRAAADKTADEARAHANMHRETVRDAKAAGGDATAKARDATREAKALGKDAERGVNRADRMERRIETDTGGGRVRGDFSATSSRTGRWTHNIMDDKALRAVCGPLGEHFTDEALMGAVYQFMVAHRDGFEGERAEDPRLPGVVFIWETGLAIKA